MDSFLYQTVGQDAIETVTSALDVPLYRRVITGSAVEQGSEYGVRNKNAKEAGGVQGDETEDLFDLLMSVKVFLFSAHIRCFILPVGRVRLHILLSKVFLLGQYCPIISE